MAAQERLLTEADVVSSVLEASPDARAALADVRAAEAAVRGAAGARRPTLSATGSGGHTELLASSIGGAIVRQQTDSLSLGSSATIQTDLGTVVDLGLSSSVSMRTSNLNPASTMLNVVGPIYSTSVTLGLRQPLVRGAGDDASLGPLRQARASARAAELTRHDTLSALVRDALVAHHELGYAEATYEVGRRARDLAEQQRDEARARLGLGTGSRIDVLRTESALATAESNLRQASAQLERAAVALAALLGVSSERAPSLRVAAEEPPAADVAPSGLLVERAIGASPSLAALDAQIVAARELEATRRDADQVQLDLTASLGAGVVFNDASLSTFALPDGRPAWSGTVGLELGLPLGPGDAHAAREQASAQLEAAIARREARARSLATDVASERASWQAASERTELARAALESASALAEAERAALALGTTTTLALVQAQQDEESAALTLLRARADRRESEIRLAYLTGSLLEAWGITPEATRARPPASGDGGEP